MKHITLQFARYSVVGACATSSQYVVLVALVELLHIQPFIASTIGSIIGSVVSYYMNHRFTFKSAKRHRDALWQFYSIAAVGTALNALFMYIGVNKLHQHYFAVQVMTTGLVLFWNFAGNRQWTFKH